LPKKAVELIAAQPKLASNPYVFASATGRGHFNSFSEQKELLDKMLRAELPEFRHWVHHDLRRTARSLMSRAGVLPHIAERTVGHAVDELEDTYDRYEYLDEKSMTLEKVAALIDTILDPPSGNVVALGAGRAPNRERHGDAALVSKIEAHATSGAS
jgi:integrase